MHRAFKADKRDNAISQFGQKPREAHSHGTPKLEIGPRLYFTKLVAQCGLAINCTSTSPKQCFTVKCLWCLLSLFTTIFCLSIKTIPLLIYPLHNLYISPKLSTYVCLCIYILLLGFYLYIYFLPARGARPPTSSIINYVACNRRPCTTCVTN